MQILPLSATDSGDRQEEAQALRDAQGIGDVLAWRARHQPDRVALRFLARADGPDAALSYTELHAQARRLAHRLRQHAAPGERVMLLLPNGLPYVRAFFACLQAGLIAVPAYPADTPNPQHYARLCAMAEDCAPRLLLVEAALPASPRLARLAEGGARILDVAEDSDGPELEAAATQEIAFLQYTSGSTATPKGVVVTQANILANEAAMAHSIGVREDDVFISWLPLYHDMGMIGGLLAPIYTGRELVLLTPEHFLASPIRWLRVIQRYRGSISGGPNFAYQLCLDRIADSAAAEIDLSSWRVAFCGAEPVRAATMQGFAERFAAAGFRGGALYPCYGLAEATLFVSGGRAGEGADMPGFGEEALRQGRLMPMAAGSALVGAGTTAPHHQLRIVDPASGRECAPGMLGEVWVQGPSVAAGYWNRPDATAESFGARLEGEAGTYLRTGDLGAWHAGRLFIAGRLKDLILLRGQNLYPQDLEQRLAEQVSGLRPGRIAAFAVPGAQGEGIGIAAEIARRERDEAARERILEEIAACIAEHVLEVPALILLLEPGGLPRTSSGKLRRSACLPGWRAGELPVLAQRDAAAEMTGHVAPRTPLEARLCALWQEVLSLPRIGVEDDFLRLGGQSLDAMRLLARLREEFGVEPPPAFVFEARSVAAQAAWLASPSARPEQHAPLRRSDDKAPPPLTPGQEGLWFLWNLDPASVAYTVSGSLLLEGALEEAALRRALDALVARHAVLRMVVAEEEGVARQALLPLPGYEWRSQSLPETALEAHRTALLARPFDLRQGPLLRVDLVRLGAARHVLTLSMHHIVADGWSIGVLLREVAALYEAARRGIKAALPELPVSYADYARWQREWLDEAALSAQLAHWRARLGEGAAETMLPFDRPRRAGAALGAAGHCRRTLSPTLTASLRRVSQAEGATLFMTLLSALSLLLGRYGASEAVQIGVPMAGRERAELQGLVGYFVNTVVVRTELAGHARLRDLLGHVRERVLEAQAHQALPFARLVEALRPERGAGAASLFQVMFNAQTGAAAGLQRFGDAEARLLEGGAREAQFELVLNATETTEGVALGFDYAASLFDAASVERLATQYVSLLEQFAASLDRPLGALLLPAPVEPPAQRPIWRGVLERIAEQAARRADAEALWCEGERLNHGALWSWSNRVAQGLARRGVAREERVGLCLTRGLALPAGLLGILKAGAAFVPLDPDYPPDRLRAMLRDGGIRRVVVDAQTASQLGDVLQGHETLPIESFAEESDAEIEVEIHPDQLAYVIYTSGSTGTPKGVAISHGALALHLDDFIPAFGYTASDAVLQFSTFNFDGGIEQLLPGLCVGGRVVMRGPSMWDLDRLSAVLRDEAVTVADIPTAYWQQWQSRLPEALPALRRVTVGGEALPGDALRRWREGPLGHVRLDNRYGPTETTISVLYRRTEASDEASVMVPIGSSYPHRSAQVLDVDGNPVPEGGVGELCIGGDSLARGYLNRPGLTAERFVPDPWGHLGGRLYRTGDLCRRRADGVVEFLGRIDGQVKLRGYRIELGEIEAALRGCAGVDMAAAALRGEGAGRRIIGYVTGTVDAATVLAELRDKLPGPMVPSVVVVLEALPSLPNGKLDRNALPEPEQTTAAIVAPRDATEEKLLRIWQAVLGRDAIGVEENFFAAGGDSILSLQLVARARQAGLRLTPKDVFENPTIAQMARVAQALAAAERQAERHEALPLTPIQARFFAHHPEAPSHWNQSVLLRVKGRLEETALRAAIAALLRRHDALRLRFENTAQGWQQRVVPADSITEIPLSLEALPETGWEPLLQQRGEALQRSLDIGQGPLLRAGYFPIGDGAEGRLLLAIHHLAVDGVSWRILLEELQQGYAQARSGAAVELPPVGTPWSAWVAGLREAAQRPALAEELGWWQAMLAPAAGQALPIPPLPGRRLDQSDVLRWEISPERTRQLLAEAPRAYRLRVDELLLAALAQTLSRWGDRAGVLLDLEAHGREEEEVSGAELSRTVGWFTARHPLWLAAQGSADAALRGAKAALRAVPAKGVRWGQLRHLADPALQAKAAALAHPQVSFNYLGQFDQSLAAEGMFGFAQEAAGSAVSGESRLDHALDINALVAEGRLSVSCRYSPAQLDTPTAQQLMRDFAAEVERLIAHCAEAQMVITPEDVPLAKLDATALAKLPLPVGEIADLYAATPLQQGLLFHSLLESGEGVYVNQLGLQLGKGLRPDLLRAAWQHAVDRHDILRTQFVWPEGGEAVQLVRRTATLPWAEQDWSGETGAGYAARLAEWRRADLARGFDLSQPPLLRVAVFLRPDGGHDVMLTNHHVLLDGWSSAQLLSEVLRDYAARLRGEAAALPPPVPFRRYVAWLQAQPSAEGWWRARLAALSQPAQGLLETLPAPRDPQPGHGEKRQHLSAELSQRLRQAAQGGAVTLNTLMQGAWALLLARRGGRGPVVFGVTVSGRPAELAEAERMQGLFINSLPIWVEVPSSQPLSAWLGELQRLNGAMRQHEHTPLHRLQQWAGQPGEALFDSLLVFENYPVDPDAMRHDLPLLSAESSERTHYPLSLAVLPGAEALQLKWAWRSDRIDAAQIEALSAEYNALLALLCNALDQPLGALRLPASVEPPAQRPIWRGVLERIGEQAARRATAEALWCDGERLSHGALWSWSNRVAQGLARRGVAREERIGLCLTRGLALPAGLLGILKAGAAFVPLDPDYPPDRLRAMLRDGGITRVLVDAQTASQLGDVLQGHETLPIESFADESDAEIAPEIHPDQLAYVIYTSGSTGTPKGVAISHRSLALHLDDFQQRFAVGAADRVLQFSTVNFDAFLDQLLAPLSVGAAVVMRGPGLWDMAVLNTVLAEQSVSLAYLPCAYWQQWLHDLPAALPSLRVMMVGGEALPGDALRRWFEGPLGHVRLDNRYGPTETTVTALVHETRAVDGQQAIVPIGRSYPHRSAQVLDMDGNPVPEGGVGELCIGGDSLARGYLNRPGLTAERFVPDPWGHPGGRLYRTGDLCRRRADGVVEFLGRIDGQVKLRGYRIELGEIEAALRGCAGVAMAAAALRGEGAGRRIIGYVTGAVDAATVLSELRDKLPGPMVPSAVVVLAALPSLPNGKLDRNALPEPEQTTVAIVAPRDAMEDMLCRIWSSVLQQKIESVEDNFFARGGHSLLALQAASRLSAELGRHVPVSMLFQHPTPAALAVQLQENREDSSASESLMAEWLKELS